MVFLIFEKEDTILVFTVVVLKVFCSFALERKWKADSKQLFSCLLLNLLCYFPHIGSGETCTTPCLDLPRQNTPAVVLCHYLLWICFASLLLSSKGFDNSHGKIYNHTILMNILEEIRLKLCLYVWHKCRRSQFRFPSHYISAVTLFYLFYFIFCGGHIHFIS